MFTKVMAAKNGQHDAPVLKPGLIIIVGGFGSGKSEVSVNLARFLANNSDQPVALADLDIINPYFRSREAATTLEEHSVRLIIPQGDQAQADLPIITPEIKGSISDVNGFLILDVGGDDLGARVLASLADSIKDQKYEMLLVLNKNRPFTATVSGAEQLIQEIESASSLKFTGLISNSHLIEHTDTDCVIQGIELSEEVSAATDLPIVFAVASTEIAQELEPSKISHPLLSIERILLKPWERS